MADTAAAGGRELPEWIRSPFQEFLDHQNSLSRVLHLSMSGIAMLRGRHQALKVLAEIDGTVHERAIDLDAAAKEKELAETEVDNGFPLLHEQATVFLWGSLEFLILNVGAAWLRNHENAWRVDAINRLRVRLGDYEGLDPEARSVWIVELLDQELAGPLKAGVNRFESLLRVWGLDGPLDTDVGKVLLELSQVRNVIVHRRGRVDRKLSLACPWLGLEIGAPLKVTHSMWDGYNGAVAAYVLELIQRTRVVFGLERYQSPATAEPSNMPLQPTAADGQSIGRG
jgi:hypothetical protein